VGGGHPEVKAGKKASIGIYCIEKSGNRCYVRSEMKNLKPHRKIRAKISFRRYEISQGEPK